MRFEDFHRQLLLRYIEAQYESQPESASEVQEAEGGTAVYDALGLETRLIVEDTRDRGEVVLLLLKWLSERVPRIRMDLGPLTRGVLPSDLRAMGCQEKTGAQVLVRSTSGHDLFRAKADERIVRAEGPMLERTLDAIARGFGEGDKPHKAMREAGACYTRLGEHFALLDEGEVVAGGALFVSGDIAYLSGGSVLPSHRGRQIHSELIRHRLVRAAELGASQAWVTCAPESASERNLLGAGFVKAYLRAHFVFEREEQA